MISITVPCYDEEEVLDEFYRRTTADSKFLSDQRCEIVFVDDGSRDRTWSVMTRLADTDPHVVAVKLMRNHGHQLAASLRAKVT